jgi:hypothetical protein
MGVSFIFIIYFIYLFLYFTFLYMNLAVGLNYAAIIWYVD